MDTQNVYIVAAVRTPIGKMGGTLRAVPAHRLASHVLCSVMDQVGIPKEAVEEVILGQTRQSSDASNIARYALLAAGFPERIPASTVMQQCSSSMLAVHTAADKIMLGRRDMILAGGVESLSTAPYYLSGARYGFGVGNGILLDSVTEGQINSQPTEIYGSFSMGVTAENIAEKYCISRAEQDAFALGSQTKYAEAKRAGKFKEEIAPIEIPQKKGAPIVFSDDEHPRDTSLEALARLKPIFKENGREIVNDGKCTETGKRNNAVRRSRCRG